MTNIPVEERVNWIGASESAILLGVSPFGTPFELWYEKAGQLPRGDHGGERIDAGRHLEPAIAAWAAERWNWNLRNVPEYLTHPTVPKMGCSLDFEDADDGAPVEIKNVDGLIFKQQWTAEGGELLDAPIYYLIQVQHQLACRPDAPHGWLIACVGGNRLFRLKVPRHQGAIARIEGAIREFWASVEAGVPPAPDFNIDAAAVMRLYATIDGAEPVDLTDDNRLPDLCAEYKAAGQAEKEAKARKDAAKAEILTKIGGAARAFVNGFNVSAGMVNRKEHVVAATSYRSFRITEKRA
jgi:putative phage-type endonuclease